MPVTLRATPVTSPVTVPGTAELEFTVEGLGNRKLDVVVLYTVMDNAAIRLTEGASLLCTIGSRSSTLRRSLGLERTDNPTPGAFRVKAVVMEDGKPMAECIWNLHLHSSATAQAMKAMANVAPDAPYVPLPDDDELTALAERADRNTARKKAAGKKTAGKKAAATKGGAAKKAGAKKSATKKSGTKAAATKTTAKRTATKKSTVKKTGAKKTATKKGAAKKAATKRPAAKKKSAAKKKGASRR